MFTLVIKAIEFVNLSWLVISSEEEKVLRVFNLVGQQKHNGFDRLLASIYIIPKEKIIFLGWEPPIIEYLKKILKLAMYVAYYFDRRLQL